MTRTITVKGIGSASATPDYITISLSVEGLHKEYDKALTDATEKVKKIQEAAISTGFAAEDLKTTDFQVDTRYDSIRDAQGNYQREFVGYVCSFRLKLSFDFDSARLGAVISAIADGAGNPELSIVFTVKDPSKVSEELLISAAQNARAKADILCRASNIQLGQLVSIDYNWSELNFVSQTNYSMGDCTAEPMVCNFSAPDIHPDDINLRDTATFVWEII